MEKQRILLRIGNSRSQKPPNSIWMSTNWISFFSTISPFIQDSQSSRATEMKTANRITNKTTIYPNYLQSKTQQFITSTRDTCPRYSCDNPFFFFIQHTKWIVIVAWLLVTKPTYGTYLILCTWYIRV
jgi:hypothetical protein